MTKNDRKKIKIEELAFLLIDSKIATNYFDNLIEKFRKEVESVNIKDDNLNKYFLEYLIFDLFTDHACFILALGPELGFKLFEIYSTNIIVRFSPKGYKINFDEFERLYKKRFFEYHQCLQEYDPEYLKK